jgi:hypothetical protein
MKHLLTLFVVVMTACAAVAELQEVNVSACPARSDAASFLNDFVWPEHPAELSNCVSQVSAPYGVTVRPLTGRIGANMEIRFSAGNELRLSVTGYRQTVFAVASNVLYIAEFCPSRSGCSLVAFDLRNAKQLWETRLHGIMFVCHSMYDNRVQIQLTPTLVVVRGREGGGDYAECLDRITGKVVGHRIFRHYDPKVLKRTPGTGSSPSTEDVPSVEK